MGVAITTGDRAGAERVATGVPSRETTDVAAAAADFAALLAGRDFESPQRGLSDRGGRHAASDEAAVERAPRSRPERARTDETDAPGRRQARPGREGGATARPEHTARAANREKAAVSSEERAERSTSPQQAERAATNDQAHRAQGSTSARADRPDESKPTSPGTGKPSAPHATPTEGVASRTVPGAEAVAVQTETPKPSGPIDATALPTEDVAESTGSVATESGETALAEEQSLVPDDASAEASLDSDAAPADPAEVEASEEGIEVSDDARSERHAPRAAASKGATTTLPFADVVTADVHGAERIAVPGAPAATQGAPDAPRAVPTAVAAVSSAGGLDVDAGGSQGAGAQSQGQGSGSAPGSSGAQSAQAGAATASSAPTARLIQTASVLPGQGSTAPSWVERLSERMRLMKSPDRVELRLEIEPRGLGQIDVRLRLDGDGLRAMIVAENEQTRALLANQQHLLEAALAEEDVRLASFDLDLGGDETAEGGDRREGAAASTGPSEARGAEADERSTTTITAADLGPGRLSVRV